MLPETSITSMPETQIDNPLVGRSRRVRVPRSMTFCGRKEFGPGCCRDRGHRRLRIPDPAGGPGQARHRRHSERTGVRRDGFRLPGGQDRAGGRSRWRRPVSSTGESKYATGRAATTWPGIPSGSAWTLVLDVFGVHQVGVLVRQLVQHMQVLGANRLAKGGRHRPGMLTCLLIAAPSALFGSHAAVELLTVEPLWPLAR